MFRPAEHGPVQLGEEVAFLLSFRAIAYERFAKLLAARWAGIQRQFDCGQPFEVQAEIQALVHYTLEGTKLALADMQPWKEDYDAAFKATDYSQFFYIGFEFEGVLPLVGCGALMPEYDFKGRLLQLLGQWSKDVEHITFNLTVLDGRSVFVLGWLGRHDGPAAAFARSFGEHSVDDIADAMIRLAFEHIENIYLRPSWWNGLPPAIRLALAERMRSGGPLVDRVATCLVADGNSYLPEARVGRVVSKLS